MGRERRSSCYTSPNRSPPRRERYSRTASSHSKARSSHSQEKKPRFEENHGTKKPAYGGPKEPLVLDSNIQISVNSKRCSSPVRPTNATRIVTVRPRGEGKSHNSGEDRNRYERDSKRRYDSVRNASRRDNITVRGESYRKFLKHECESPSPNRRKMSPYRGRREVRKRSHDRKNETYRNGRYDHHERLKDRRRTNSSIDRRHEGSIQSSRRSGYDDKLEKERNYSKRHSSRKNSYDESEKSSHTDVPECSENENETEDHEDALTPNCGPIPLGIRPPLPMWGPMLPYRPPIFLPPRPPLIPSPMGYVFPPRPRFFPFPRPPPGIYFPPRPLPPPLT